jgi:hypothetical protein
VADQTFQIALSPNISAPAGAGVRIKLSDPGFLSEDDTGPLRIGAATIADSYLGAEPAQTPRPLKFGGLDTVTIPEGGDVYSDPLTLPFAITAGQAVLVSIWITNSSLPVLPLNAWADGGVTWAASSSTANETEDTTGTPFTGSTGSSTGTIVALTALDVTTPAESSATPEAASPGAPTVVVAGDNLIDPWSSDPAGDSLDFPSQRVAGQLAGLLPAYAESTSSLDTFLDGLASYGVVDAGIGSNQLLADGTSGGGVSLLAWVDSDILAEPDVGTVVLDEGLEDVLRSNGSSTFQTDLENAYTLLGQQLGDFGINVITADLTPCTGYSNSAVGDSCSSAIDTARSAINYAIDGDDSGFYCPVGFDSAVSNGASPEALAPGYGTADDVNLTLGSGGGYAQLAKAVLAPSIGSSIGCSLAPNNPSNG